METKIHNKVGVIYLKIRKKINQTVIKRILKLILRKFNQKEGSYFPSFYQNISKSMPDKFEFKNSLYWFFKEKVPHNIHPIDKIY